MGTGGRLLFPRRDWVWYIISIISSVNITHITLQTQDTIQIMNSFSVGGTV